MFAHFYNIASAFHDVSSVSSKNSSVTHSNETFSFLKNCGTVSVSN